jgi:hypothetical protein
MPNSISNPAAGTDGVVPVRDTTGLWKTWNLSEIYTGGVGTNRYVPNVNDYVEDIAGNVTYRVTAVDPVTLISTMVQIRSYGVSAAPIESDILTYGPRSSQPETLLVYVNTNVFPYAATIDSRVLVNGSMNTYAKLFLGTNTSTNGTVLSKVYDAAGNYISENVALQLAATNGNLAEKYIPTFYLGQTLDDGELVTLVIYADDASETYARQFLVKNTTFSLSVASSQKYVTGVSMKSPFMSSGNDNILNLPLNLPLSNLNLTGVVSYSDGTSVEMPVDGTKFQVFGLEQYVATVVGQTAPMVLTYTLGANETAIENVSYDGKRVSEKYELVTVAQEGSYNVKLFAYPEWIDATNGYQLRWWLYNLDRDIHYDVTSLVTFNASSQSFKPKAYGTLQQLSVRINLNDVSATFDPYIHTQALSVVLVAQGTQRTTNWTLAFEPTQDPMYGVGVHARLIQGNDNLYKLKVGSDFTSFDAWLKALYYNTKPIFSTTAEVAPPVPNYFVVHTPTQEYAFPMTSWNSELTVGAGLAINGTTYIRFISRSAQGDKELAIAGLPTYSY